MNPPALMGRPVNLWSPDRLWAVIRSTKLPALAVALNVAYLSLWHVRVTGHLSLAAFASFLLFVLLCMVYGHIFLAATAGLVRNKAGVVFQLLCGFFLFNTLLFVLSLVSPLGMVTNVSVLSLSALALVALVGRSQPKDSDSDSGGQVPSLLCILLSGAAATLWCSDSQPMLLIQGQTAIYQTWQDTFFHVRQLSTFANAHGIGTIHDMTLSGAPTQVYHYASYQSAAAFPILAGAHAIDAYSSFHLPLGIFLTGLAAFSLGASIWGGWPALAAVVAVVLVPDAYQQGFANRYLSYNFLAQVNLGMLYGIACVAIAWIFILEGIRRGKALSILIGYWFLVMCLFYKAHIFVANAFLIMMYPCLFFPGARPWWRLIIGIVLTALFVSVISLSQSIDRVPILRLNGSGIGQYILVLLKDFDGGLLKTFFTQVFIHEHHSKPVEAMYVVAMLLLSTFGIWIFAAPLVTLTAKGRIATAVLLFPVFIVVNYLVMSIGLAMDTRGIGTADELLNRPLVWAYFAVVTWTAGAAYYLAVGDRLPKSRAAQSGLFALICLSLASTLYFAKNLQTFPTRKGLGSYAESNAVPLCLVRASEYIRDHSRPHDIVQDSENDPRLVVTALAERQLFVAKTIWAKAGGEQQERADELETFRAMRGVDELKSYTASRDISWYLLRPSTAVLWPASFLQLAVFDCEGYRVYRFAK